MPWALMLMAGLVIGLASPRVSLAQVTRGGGAHPGGTWRGGVGEWRGGRWYLGRQGDRYGWWWVVPGYDWYAYDVPVYPSPAYPNPEYPDAPVSSYYWYYCQSPAGYYPYVQQCPTPWRPIPAPG
ncbi:MAG TPA: hypothetical protein VFC56_05595 [Stellaceae bacterium]|nr:hypothetical protein [Stellaceae bacterium]